jgi:hypothetical protein
MRRVVLGVGFAVAVGVSALIAGNRAQSVHMVVPPTLSFAKAIISHSPVLYPNALAAGDLNGDGFADIAVVSFDNSQSMWYGMGKGNGHFDHWSDHVAASYEPSFVIFGDADGDGNLDAITTNFEPSLTIAFGNGKGHFPAYIRPDTGSNCLTVESAVADLNGDGIPDIVGTCFNELETPGMVFVLLGEGHRKFKKAMRFSTGGHAPYGIAVGDLNHDGIPDLVVANNGADQPPYDYNLAVLLGKGDGTFGAPVRYRVGVRPWQPVLADFNGDGNLDVAVATTGNVHTVRVLLGNGDGTFGAARAFESGSYPTSLVTADFNGDGELDLATNTCAVVGHCHISVLLGNGDGTFQAPIKFPVGVGPTGLVTADFNHDGKPDLATLTGDAGITVLLNTSQFPAPTPVH